MRFVDLSLEIKEGLGDIPAEYKYLEDNLSAKVKHTDHKENIPTMLSSFPGITSEDLPDGLAWADDYLSLGVHMGTHMDAPWHYHPTSEGKKSKTIDEIPLEYCFNDGVVLDMTHKEVGKLISVKDIQDALQKINYKLKPLDIVLIRTDADKLWDTLGYWTDYTGVGREGTIWLVDQGVKVVGTDAAGWDRPFHFQAREFRETKNRSLIWEGHFAGIEREYYQMEKLTNLDKLPPYGFKVSCFPIKILDASAAWVRPVAIIEKPDVIVERYDTKTALTTSRETEDILEINKDKAIVVKNLVKKFDNITAVNDLSFEVKKGEIFGLLGPNGAGKTTTIKILSGLISATSGDAFIEGYNVKKDINKVKEIIGVCPQQAAIYKFLTGRENLELFGNLHTMNKNELKERADKLLEAVNFTEASKRKSKGYSGGMIRQINLLIAIINNPKIAFLDEPTVGMDPRARRATWNFIGSLKKEGKTVILTTHYIEEAEALSDNVAIIDYGELIAYGPPKELMEKYESKNLEDVFMKITGRRILEGV
ncbi:MAG: cyclase family protein [Promethearchaeota archaeon]